MAQIKYWDGEAAIVQVFFAPGVLSPEVISEMVPNFEVKVFENCETLPVNAFVRKVVKNRDYYALLAIECKSLQQAHGFANILERRQKNLAEKIRNSIHQAIKTM